jgi:hemerythrin-like metal-binding protein
MMDTPAWKDSFSIGIDNIDSQHQKLIGLLDQCIKKAVSSKNEFLPVLNDMKEYADTHFRAEEQLMLTINFPGLEEHKNQHRLFEENLGLLEKEVNNWEKLTIVTMTSFLRDWFIQHILDCDKQIGVYIRSNG